MTETEKRQFESKIVSEMIHIYCRGNHHTKQNLCPECSRLLEHTQWRAAACPFIKTKTFCSSCSVHCYAPNMRLQIKRVMRYAGPRMLLRHPLLTLRHAVESSRNKKRLEMPQ